MLAKYEKRTYVGSEHVWVGKYRNLHNISHWHLEHELIVCCQGSARVMINDRLFTVHGGECAFCPSGSVHYINAGDDAIVLICIFDEKLTHGITDAHRLDTPVFADRYGVASVLASMLDELSRRPLFFSERTEGLVLQLMADVFRGEPINHQPTKPSAVMTRYKELLCKLDGEYEFISFSEAAEYMNFSQVYFSGYFKRQSGMTFTQYMNVVKIEKAVQLLSAGHGMKMSEVMSRCGFNTIRSFNRTFKELTGYSPRQIPPRYSLNTRSVQSVQDTFDPTLDVSVLL